MITVIQLFQYTHTHNIYIYIYVICTGIRDFFLTESMYECLYTYRVSQEECARLRESVS